ncbi:hypothetical protein QP400_00360 [Winkia sp. UMB3158]|nr:MULTISPECIES: hypothetical protein [Terrabacteria group]MDK6471409.1 hypothetical protein [Streptococcus agalactiae]MDK7148585.1 hypothetical protein [Winkia sp. UMB3158]OFT55550.1 hypothetical protein HMPREF3152_04600 [Actinomyces sp. HMSC06A08]
MNQATTTNPFKKGDILAGAAGRDGAETCFCRVEKTTPKMVYLVQLKPRKVEDFSRDLETVAPTEEVEDPTPRRFKIHGQDGESAPYILHHAALAVLKKWSGLPLIQSRN